MSRRRVVALRSSCVRRRGFFREFVPVFADPGAAIFVLSKLFCIEFKRFAYGSKDDRVIPFHIS